MSWPSAFLMVPVSAIRLSEPLSPSPKASAEQLRTYMRNVPEVYQRLNSGYSAADFARMRESPLNERERRIADTYRHLYADTPGSERLEAEFVEGSGLSMTRGRHRLEAAREVGLTHLPVHVRAPDLQTLDRVTAELKSTRVDRGEARLNRPADRDSTNADDRRRQGRDR